MAGIGIAPPISDTNSSPVISTVRPLPTATTTHSPSVVVLGVSITILVSLVVAYVFFKKRSVMNDTPSAPAALEASPALEVPETPIDPPPFKLPGQ